MRPLIEEVVDRLRPEKRGFNGSRPLDRTDLTYIAGASAEVARPLSILEIADIIGCALVPEASGQWAETPGLQSEVTKTAIEHHPGLPVSVSKYLDSMPVQQGEWLATNSLQQLVVAAAKALSSNLRLLDRELWMQVSNLLEKGDIKLPEIGLRPAEIASAIGHIAHVKYLLETEKG